MLLGCYNDILFVLSCRVNMSSINFPNIDHENLPKWEGDLAPLECIEVIEETHNVKSFRFKSKKEDGGLITGNLNGKAIKSAFGYFTPNLGNNMEIVLDDQGGIEIKNLP